MPEDTTVTQERSVPKPVFTDAEAGAKEFPSSRSRSYNYFEPRKRRASVYEDVTVDVQPDPERHLTQGWVYAFADGTEAFLYPTPNAGTSKASQAFWQVDDVDAEIAELKSRGVVFETYPDMPGERSPSGAITAGGAKAAWFKDSEGNILAIIQDVSA